MYFDDDMRKAGYYCDAEIGSVKDGWHTCNAKATLAVERETYNSYSHTLHLCDKHATRQELDHVERQIFRNRAVYTIQAL